MKLNLQEQTVAEIVSEHYRAAEVFRRYGIDFCCGGQARVAEVCARKGIDPARLQAELEAALSEKAEGSPDFRSWSASLLADYIEERHHTYVRDKLPMLRQYSEKVARVHGHAHPEVIRLARMVEELANELEQHLLKEERVLFPYVRQLVRARKGEAELVPPPFGSVQNPLSVMRHEHDHAGELMKQMRTLTNDFTPPEYACNTWRVLYQLLDEFERDLHLHVHLENNLLFPKAEALEKELLAAP